MAASLSRPDPSSPASVAEAAFNTSRRGYQTDEVRAFLVAVAAELGRLQERERQLEAELDQAREISAPTELDDETVASVLGEETLRVLHTARESASQIKIRAEETASRLLHDANDEANRVRQEADVEIARRRQDAQSDAEAEVALAKQQGREMVNEARAYRERVLADLERRTTLARQQIDELAHGRDRLLQVFERARLVAVDVTSELKAIDSPDELVNLTPTTGPVPIMVPNDRRGRDESADAHGDPQAASASPAVDERSDDEATESSDAGERSEVPDAPGDGSNADAADVGDAAVVDSVDSGEHDEVAGTAGTADETEHADETAGTADETTADETTADETEHAAETQHAEDVDDGGATGDATVGDATADPVDAADADSADADATGPDTATDTDDTNVVSLFSGRRTASEAASDDAHPSTELDADTGRDVDDDRPDVDGIFARLRDAVPDDAPDVGAADAETGATADEVAAGHEVAAGDDDRTGATADEVAAVPTAFTRRDEALVPLIVGGARRVKRVLADEQNEALDTLRQGDPVAELDDVVPTVDDHVATYVAALLDDMLTAAAAGAGELGINDTKTLRKKLVRSGALNTAEAYVRSALVVPLRDRVERAVTDGAGDNDDITKRVRAVYREWKTQHIDDQLDDVFRSAYAGGLHASVKPGTPVLWAVDPARPACPDCEDNSLAGAVPAGDEFPTGHRTGPAHPGCTCLTLPAE